MEKEKLFMGEEVVVGNTSTTPQPTWNCSNIGMEFQPNDLNCTPQQLPNCFFNPNWENSLDQSDPFESALSSIVSSPAGGAISSTGDNNNSNSNNNYNNVMIREVIGKLGNICNSGEISPQSYIASNYNNSNNQSTNTSCYSTPLNSPPKLNLSIMGSHMRGGLDLPIPASASHPTLAPFSADPGFAERAARFSCFGGFNGQLGVNGCEFPASRSIARIDCGKISKVSSLNQLGKVSGSQMGGAQDKSKGSSAADMQVADDKKLSNRLSRSSTPEKGDAGDSREGSTVSEQIMAGSKLTTGGEGDGNTSKRKPTPRGKAKDTTSSSAKDPKGSVENEESRVKRSKTDQSNGKENEGSKTKAEPSEGTKGSGDGNQKESKEDSKPPEPPKDYIHVRARRGQATDSHSLAERVRREKISERMKLLQDLVPGCNKVTGKAVMLDEIINYVQSLQRQVEFLSMKLATVNPRMDFNMEAIASKDMFQSRGSMPHNLYPTESSMAAFPYGYQTQQILPQLHNMSNGMETQSQFPINPMNSNSLQRNPNLQIPCSMDGFGEASTRVPSLWEDDLQTLVQMGFGQNQHQNFQGSMGAAQMKIEL